jgi:hypothetical protein
MHSGAKNHPIHLLWIVVQARVHPVHDSRFAKPGLAAFTKMIAIALTM